MTGLPGLAAIRSAVIQSSVIRSAGVLAVAAATHAVAALLCMVLLPAVEARAQEPAGLEVAASLETALSSAIAGAEKSLVAIARVKRGEREEVGPLELRADPFGRMQIVPSQPRPGDPEFIPNDYGTGVVVDRRGLILTAYHVLGEDSDHYVTTADRKVYFARVKAADPRSDMAVLSIEATDLVPIKFGDASNLKKGQFVLALGNPYAIARDGQVSASWGIIANLERKAPPTPDETNPTGKNTLQQYGTLIQTDARLNLGTSGGALLNLKGEMIGLTTSLAALSGYEQSAGYAIPVDETFRRAVDALKQGREVEYGFLGVRPDNLREPEVLAGRQGVRVGEVVDGTPAQRFGLQRDDVITHVNGRAIHDADGLVLHVGKLPVDAVVQLTVERDGRVAPLNVELTKYAVRGKKIVTTPLPNWRGLRVDYASTAADFQLRIRRGNQFGLRRGDIDPQGCVLVTEVEKDSPAWREGVRPDMLITHVGNARVATPKEFYSVVSGKDGPVQVRLTVPEDDHPVRTIGPAESVEEEPAG